LSADRKNDIGLYTGCIGSNLYQHCEDTVAFILLTHDSQWSLPLNATYSSCGMLFYSTSLPLVAFHYEVS